MLGRAARLRGRPRYPHSGRRRQTRRNGNLIRRRLGHPHRSSWLARRGSSSGCACGAAAAAAAGAPSIQPSLLLRSAARVRRPFHSFTDRSPPPPSRLLRSSKRRPPSAVSPDDVVPSSRARSVCVCAPSSSSTSRTDRPTDSSAFLFIQSRTVYDAQTGPLFESKSGISDRCSRPLHDRPLSTFHFCFYFRLCGQLTNEWPRAERAAAAAPPITARSSTQCRYYVVATTSTPAGAHAVGSALPNHCAIFARSNRLVRRMRGASPPPQRVVLPTPYSNFRN